MKYKRMERGREQVWHRVLVGLSRDTPAGWFGDVVAQTGATLVDMQTAAAVA